MKPMPTILAVAKGCTGFEHRAGDVEEAAGDRSQCPAMAMTSASEF
jgi:hypothetical protein